MDTYQGSLQHASIIAQSIPNRDPCLQEDEIDHEDSWVMLKENGAIEPLENEHILLKTPDRVSFDLSVPTQLRTANSAFSVKCDDGNAYVTNRRIIYLAARPTDKFQSFSAFILDVHDPKTSTAWFGLGAWVFGAEATPRAGGGIPSDIPRVKFTLTFNNGGVEGFNSKYKVIYERLVHARDIQRETGARIVVHDDDLPAYTPTATGSSSVPPAAQSTQPQTTSQTQTNQPTPNEPPPDYDEAQAQAVEIQFEERDRQDAERAQ